MLSRFKIILTVLTMASFGVDLQAETRFSTPEIQFRFDSRQPFEVPAQVSLAVESPVFGDDGRIFLRFSRWNAEAKTGIMTWHPKTYLNTRFFKGTSFPTGMSYSSKAKKLVFEVANFGYYSEGVFGLSSKLENLETIWKNQDDLFTSNVAVDEGLLYFRARKDDGSQRLSIINLDNSQRHDLLMSGVQEESLSWIFTPHLSSDKKWLVLKLRKGKAGKIAEEEPDEIRLYSKQRNGQLELKKVLQDADASPLSKFLSFDNVVKVNSLGDFVFIAKGLDGKRGIYLSRIGGGIETVAVEKASDDIQEIGFFYPSINDRGEIVFRAKDHIGDALYYFYNGELQKLLSYGDKLKSDKGDVSAGHTQVSEAFIYMSPQINNHGDVLFGALVHKLQSQQNLGLGFYVIPRVETRDD